MIALELRTAAARGGFAVDESTGDRMIRSLEAVLDALETRWATIESLGERPRIGATAAARHVATRILETATDDRGMLTQLRAARAELPVYIEAISLAKRNYAELERSATDRLGEAS